MSFPQIASMIITFLIGVISTILCNRLPTETKEIIIEEMKRIPASIHYKITHRPKNPLSNKAINISIVFYLGGLVSIISVVILYSISISGGLASIEEGLGFIVTMILLTIAAYAFILLSQILLLYSVWKLYQEKIEEKE